MIPWGALAFVASITLAVFDAQFTDNVMFKYGIQAETNPVVSFFATMLGKLGVYLSTILPTAVLLTAATLAHSQLGLGAILGARLCLFRFQLLSKSLQKQIDEQLGAKAPAPPPPGPDAS